ncbi:MAG: HD domain-containing protein [Treponema sp.]|nr:HD domain-containing protein [Treponema sp.]
MKSGKEISLDGKLAETVDSFGLSGKAAAAMRFILQDDEIQLAQEYANTVSIVRLGYNDHGPVHMRTVAMNALVMMKLLRQADIRTSLEKDACGDFEDSLIAVICACLLHDLGMAVGRQDHEIHSAYMASPILDRILKEAYGDDLRKRVMIRALAIEGISGHMGTRTIHSLEAGVVQVADGCDMTKGRARIPLALGPVTKTGHIHQYSANSIEEVRIGAGREAPIRIDVYMSNESGFFQVEEVLLKKIAGSTAKPFIELFAQVREEEEKQYL